MLIRRIRARVALYMLGLVQRLRIFWYASLSTGQVFGTPVLFQPLHAVGAGRIRFGRGVKIGVYPSPNFLDSCAYIEARGTEAEVRIGSGTWINNGFKCIAEHGSITVGENCLIGADVEIVDSDFHGSKLNERGMSRPEWSQPVVVEDGVFIGSHARIMKGARIGAGSVIANSSLVVGDIPAGVVAGGVPAKVIRSVG